MLATTLLGASALLTGQTPTTGAALWADFSANPDDHSHMPNNAYAGYRRGEVPIPDVPVVANILDFGAVNDGTGDNSRAFREAIDAAWYAGGGAVLIPAGIYRIEQMVLLHRDGVVLRGEGAGQTILDFANPLLSAIGSTGHGSEHWNWTGGLIWVAPRDLFEVRDDGRWTQLRSAAPDFNVNAGDWEVWRNQGPITTVTSTHPRGVRSVTVADASGLAPGDFVLMTWENPPDDALWKEIVQHASFANYDFGDWLDATPFLAWPVEIESVEGDTVGFVRPTRASILPEYNVTFRRIGPSVREVGVEFMTLRMANTRETYSYNNGDGWNGVFFNRAFNSWTRGIEVVDAENSVHVASSVNISVLDVASSGALQSKYIFTNRAMSHDVLYDGFVIRNTGVLTNGINTEWLGTGNVWTRGDMDKGTFDSHRLMPFDYLRTDITMRNPAEARPGGAARAGPFTGRRAVHWNVRIQDSDRPAASRGEWVFHPVQYTYGAQIGITGAEMFTLNDNNVWAMPAGDKAMLIGDAGLEPSPANLFDAQVALRRDTQGWARLAWPLEGFLRASEATFRAGGNPPPGTTIASMRVHVNDEPIGTATAAPWEIVWADAVPGRHTVRVELVDSAGGSTWSRPYPVVVGERLRLEHNDPTILYSGPWNVLAHPEFSAGQARISEGSGARFLEVVFRGTRVRWFTRHNNHAQQVDISLNGLPVATATVHGGQTHYRFVGWDSGELPEGVHTLRISTAGRITLDHLEITSTDGAVGEPAPPTAPGNLTATAISSSEVDLLWTRGSSNEHGFRVERRVAGEGDWALIAALGASFTSFSDSGLAHGVTYEYRVQAFNVFGDSDYSAVASATTPEPVAAPAPPSDLTAAAIASNRVDLAWVNNANDQEGFTLERQAPSGIWAVIATVGPEVTSWIDLGLAAETLYAYRVRAFNSAGASAFSNIASVTTPEATDAEGNVFASSWFLQALDNTGTLSVNQPDHVAFTGTTEGQYRGAVAAISETTTLAEEGDFISLDFKTDNDGTGNNIRFTLRFGLFDDGGSPVGEDFSAATDGSRGFFVASGNRTTDGQPTDLYVQGAGTAAILARGHVHTNLNGGGISRRTGTTLANSGNRTVSMTLQRLAGGDIRFSLDMIDAANRVIILSNDIPASAVPTYTLNQIALSMGAQGRSGMDFKDITIRRGGPSFDGGSEGWTLDAWRALHFTPEELADPAISGPLADSTGAGIPNRVRHAFGLDPWENPTAFLPEVATVGGEDGVYLEIHYYRDLEAAGVTIAVEASADLLDWTSLSGSIVPWGDPEPTARPHVVREAARLLIPLDSSAPLFMRLRSFEPEP